MAWSIAEKLVLWFAVAYHPMVISDVFYLFASPFFRPVEAIRTRTPSMRSLLRRFAFLAAFLGAAACLTQPSFAASQTGPVRATKDMAV